MKRTHGLSPIQRIERTRILANECWETSLSPTKKYPQLKVNGRNISVHVLVFEHERGPIPHGLCVLHTCDNPRCHRPEHLYVGTHSQNMLDMWARGRHKKPTPRINHQQVLSLATPQTLSQKEIAQRVGATQTAISAILRIHNMSRSKYTPFNKATKKKRGHLNYASNSTN